jgi:aminoglycoside phosphotransferase family enzyme
VVIDCLEFNDELRTLDAAMDLEFLILECDRQAAPLIGARIWELYLAATGDPIDAGLRAFYRSHHAVTRAKIAAWHLDDPATAQPERWTAKARCYLEIARECCTAF